MLSGEAERSEIFAAGYWSAIQKNLSLDSCASRFATRNSRNSSTGCTAEVLASLEGQFEHRAAQVLQQDEQVVGVDQRLLGRAPEEIFGMMRQELVERTGRSDQHRRSRGIPASCPARLLPG